MPNKPAEHPYLEVNSRPTTKIAVPQSRPPIGCKPRGLSPTTETGRRPSPADLARSNPPECNDRPSGQSQETWGENRLLPPPEDCVFLTEWPEDSASWAESVCLLGRTQTQAMAILTMYRIMSSCESTIPGDTTFPQMGHRRVQHCSRVEPRGLTALHTRA